MQLLHTPILLTNNAATTYLALIMIDFFGLPTLLTKNAANMYLKFTHQKCSYNIPSSYFGRFCHQFQLLTKNAATTYLAPTMVDFF